MREISEHNIVLYSLISSLQFAKGSQRQCVEVPLMADVKTAYSLVDNQILDTVL